MIDVAKVVVVSGNGGDGSFSFRRVKYIAKGGPDGGDGGDGGSVYLVATDKKQTLIDYADNPKFKAENGEPGRGQQSFGQKGADLEIPVPLGTIVWDISDHQEKQKIGEIIHLNDRLLVAQGGEGGRGNIHFKSSTNRTPMEYEEGGEGEKRTLLLELKLLADVGLVGLPNAGKSTLLSVLTRARPKVANYPFTTLEPYLGVMDIDFSGSGEKTRYIMADLPGLIEEASQGKGLGHQFLRHIERCRVLVFLLAVPEEHWQLSPAEQVHILKDQYQVLAHELAEYNPDLAQRPSLIVINKKDILSADFLDVLQKEWPEKHDLLLISAATHDGLPELKQRIHEIVEKSPRLLVKSDETSSRMSETSQGIPVFTLPSTKHKPKLAYRPPLKK